MTAKEQILDTVDYVDLDRFMGKWYVIASIPTQLEKNIFNAVEHYQMDSDGTIATTFTYNKGSFEGPKREYHPRGFIVDRKTNAVWGMQFIWPIKADYRIIYLAQDYSSTIIGRNKRDYVWIMARKSRISEELYNKLSKKIEQAGYDIEKLIKVPQHWQ
ncbi:MAG: hypothetical protein CL398_04385 [Acidiferrobacteraceae bacterium]|nr:hypothetical protein [Acidiferrobacteraceae bacterium]|tara:strand:- start:1157 stop:1633 length:477 start_codon:yes stop_codon:yes gene_type:complete